MLKYFFGGKEEKKEEPIIPDPDLEFSDAEDCEETQEEEVVERMHRLKRAITRNLQKEYFDLGTHQSITLLFMEEGD